MRITMASSPLRFLRRSSRLPCALTGATLLSGLAIMTFIQVLAGLDSFRAGSTETTGLLELWPWQLGHMPLAAVAVFGAAQGAFEHRRIAHVCRPATFVLAFVALYCILDICTEPLLSKLYVAVIDVSDRCSIGRASYAVLSIIFHASSCGMALCLRGFASRVITGADRSAPAWTRRQWP